MWSSVRAHLAGEDDSLVSVRPVLSRWPNFRDLLLEDYEEDFTSLRTADFVTELDAGLADRVPVGLQGRRLCRSGWLSS